MLIPERLREICVNDKFWHGSATGCETALTPWLRDHGSLTLRIQLRCTKFAVHGVRSGLDCDEVLAKVATLFE